MTKDLKPLTQQSFAQFFSDKFPSLSNVPSEAPPATSTEQPAKAAKVEPSTKRAANLARALDVSQGLVPATKGFVGTEFVVLGLPYGKPPGLVHEMRNGNMTFTITGHPKYGVPYGQDHLVPMFLDTAFMMLGCPNNNTFCFSAAADVLRFLRLQPDEPWYGWRPKGPDVRGLIGAIDRIMGATYFVEDAREAYDKLGNKHQGKVRARYQLMSRYKLWITEGVHPNQHTLWPNAIELDPRHADNLRNGAAAPIDIDMVRQLRSSVILTRLALWQRWRSNTLAVQNQSRVHIPLFGVGGLLEQFEVATAEHKTARTMLKRWQRRIKEAWPKCPNVLTKDTLIVHPQPGPVMKPDARFLKRIARWDDPGSPFDKDEAAARMRTVNPRVEDPGD
jgi:hypothetical protein